MTDNDIYQSSLIFTLFKITPSLRYVYLDILRSPKKKIMLNGYYSEPPTEVEKELLDDMANDIIAITDENFDYEVTFEVTLTHFDQLKKTDFLLYARYEGLG